MKTNSRRVGFFLAILLVVPCLLVAATTEAELQPEMRTCLDDLEHPSFAKRQAASQKLAEAGPRLFPALGEAAIQGDRETTLRIVGLLKQSLRSKAESEKSAARKSLDQVAASTNTAAARAAREAIQEIEKPQQLSREQQAMFQAMQRQRFAFAPVAPAPQVWKAGQPQRTMRTTHRPDGSIHLLVQDAEAEVQIEKDAAGRIKIEVKKRKDGKEVTLKTEAATEAELKTKNAEAFQHYEKYAATIQRQKAALPARPLFAPAQFGFPGQPQIGNAIFPKVPGAPGVPGLAPEVNRFRKEADEALDRMMQDRIQREGNPAHADALRRAWDQMKAGRRP